MHAYIQGKEPSLSPYLGEKPQKNQDSNGPQPIETRSLGGREPRARETEPGDPVPFTLLRLCFGIR
jgi:hypothetical protein